MDTKYLARYKRNDESNEFIEVPYLLDDVYDDYFGDDLYEFVGVKETPFVPDVDWHSTYSIKSEDVVLRIECDYCGKNYYSTQNRRNIRASSFRKGCNSAGFNIEYGEPYLYKDNCKKCKDRKIKESTLLRRGYEHFSQTEEFKILIREVHKDSGFVKTSRGQRYIAKLLNAELNVLVDYYYADIVLDNKIVIEYDGGGHNLSVLLGDMTQEQFDANERKRSGYLFSKGYKIVRFISPAELFPEDEMKTVEMLSEAISELYLSNKREIHIELGRKVNDPVHGKLKPIKSILESSEWGEDIL